MKKVTVMRAELLLVAAFVLLGMGAWLAADRVASRLFEPCEPSLEAERIARDVPSKQDDLALLQKEQAAIEGQLVLTRVEHYKQKAKVTALTTHAPPEPPAAQEARALKREEARAQSNESELQLAELDAQHRTRRESVNALRREVEEQGRAASAEYGRKRVWYRVSKASATLAGTLLLLAAAYLLLLPLLQLFLRSARGGGYAPNTWLILLATSGLLLVLIAYQTLEMAGAAFFGALVLLFFLWRMPWERAAGEDEAE